MRDISKSAVEIICFLNSNIRNNSVLVLSQSRVEMDVGFLTWKLVVTILL